MELFQQLRHLYVNVGNDVRHLQETVAAHPTRIGSSRLQADKLFNEPHADVRLQEEKVGAKIKELQDETHFGEVVTCCSVVLNDSLAQLDRLEQHLQKYSVQPIGNARQRCETKVEPSLSLKENEPPSAVCNPLSTAAPMATEPIQTQAKEWPMSYNIAPTPKLSDFGISESYTQRLDELTAAILHRTQLSHAGTGQCHASVGQGHASMGQGHASMGQGHASTGQGHASMGQGHASVGQGHASMGQGHASMGQGHASMGQGHASMGQGHASAGQVHASIGQGHASTAQGHASAGQGQTGDGILNSATGPCVEQPSCHSSSTSTDMMSSSSQNLMVDIGAIQRHDQDQGDIVSKKPVAKSTLHCEQSSNLIQSVKALTLTDDDENNFCSTFPLPLHSASFPRTDVVVTSGRLESSSNSKSIRDVHDLPIPSPPQLSDMARKALDFHVRDKGVVLLRSVKKELDLSPSTSLLSEQTVNILRQLQQSKISTSSMKLEPYSTEKMGENVPPDHQSTRKSHAVVSGHAAAKRCLDLGSKMRDVAALSGHVVSQNGFSTEEFVPKRHNAAAGVTVTDQISNVERSSAKSQPCVTETSTIHRHSNGTDKCKTVKSGSGFGSDDWTCPQIPHFSSDDYESLVPAAVKNVVARDRINDSVAKANDVLLNKMLNGSSMMLTVDDLKQVVGSNANLFLKLMSMTGRLSEKIGEHGIAEYSLV